MKKTYLITFEPAYTMTAQVESVHLVDKTSNPFIEVERDNQKYYINKERILYFKEYNEKTDEPIGKQY